MSRKVMVSAPYMLPVIDRFRPFFAEHDLELMLPKVRERLEEHELLGLIEEVDGVICGDDRFTSKVLDRAKKLKVISKWGTGIDSIDRAHAQKLGIEVYNTPNAFTDPVADSVLAYVLSFSRQVPWSTAAMRSGDWQKRPCVALRERTLGVIGMGNIGRAVVRRARAFGMKVLGNDIKMIENAEVVMVGLEELLQNCDFISANCDLNPTSFHLLGEREFALMKPSAVVINTARGPIIDENALILSLKDRRIAGAGLDVFENEPLPLNSPLRKLSNVLLAPHNANSSPEAWERVHQNTLQNLLKGLKITA